MRVPDRFLVDGAAWPLQRAWPRSADVWPLALELERPDGATVVGQWFASDDEARRELSQTRGALAGDDPRLVLQPDGADRKLPGLAALVADGARLLAHRPGRRAVVRLASGHYVKVVRPGRAGPMAARHRALAELTAGLADVPEVLRVGDDRVELAAVSGVPPLALAAGVFAWREAWHQVSAVLVQMARADPDGLAVHDAVAEVEVTRSWVARAVAAGRLPECDVDRLLASLLEDVPTPLGVAHRDLHDGQLLVADGRLGLLDPDTLAVAEPALDLANLLVHLQLRVDQGLLAAEPAREATAILQGTVDRLPTGTNDRVAAYARATRLRLAAVYSLRPRWHDLALRWFDAATGPVGAPT
jgi:aminoglycoside phosphotransferase (APT) family kinase protein